MAEVIKMPKMSDTMTDGVIASWHKKVGDTVKSGDILAEVETDKATMELESYEDGTLLYIGVQEKESVPVDGIIAVIGKKGEDFQALLSGKSGGQTESSTDKPAAEKEVAKEEAKPETKEGAKTADSAVDTSNIPATVIKMPKMSDTMTEGTIVAWHKKVGDKVKGGDLLAEVETDKATMELESYEDGTLLYIGVEQGASVIVDGIIAIIGKEGTDFKPLLSAGSAAPDSAKNEEKPEAETTTKSTSSASSVSPAVAVSDASGRIKASPLAKRLAKEKGIDVSEIAGSGENGRVIRKDIENFSDAPASKSAESTTSTAKTPQIALGTESFEDVPLSQMRKTIARRLSESLFTAPHFYLTMDINMDKTIEARKSINEFSDTKISFNDMVLKAVAASLRKNPKVNASWLGDKIRYNHHINIGVAVAVDEGLLVPVVRFADQKSLSQISAEVKEYGAKAKNKQLQPADWEGSTFTISNLGMFGIEEFTAIINPPDACILAVGGIKETAIVKNGALAVGNVMKVTLSCDHRVVDGAVGSTFLQTLKGLLEDPVRILA